MILRERKILLTTSSPIIFFNLRLLMRKESKSIIDSLDIKKNRVSVYSPFISLIVFVFFLVYLMNVSFYDFLNINNENLKTVKHITKYSFVFYLYLITIFYFVYLSHQRDTVISESFKTKKYYAILMRQTEIANSNHLEDLVNCQRKHTDCMEFYSVLAGLYYNGYKIVLLVLLPVVGFILS